MDMSLRDKIPLYVFDTALRAREERKKAALRLGCALWGASFLTSEELINRLYAQISSPLSPPVLRRVGRYALLTHAVREAKERGELSFFAPQSQMPGFLRHLLGFIQEMKQSKVTAEEFTTAVESPSFAKNFTQENAAEKFSELSQIYGRYEEKKSQLHVMDEYDKEDAVTKFLGDGFENLPPLFLDAYSHVCLVDLMDVSVLRFEFLKALLLHFKNSGRATAVVFPYDPDKQLIFRFLEKDLQRLESTGEEDAVTEHFWSLQSRRKNDAIRYFLEKFAGEEKFYADGSMQTEHSPTRGKKPAKEREKQAANVHVFCVEGTYRELEEAARRVRVLLEEGAATAEIGVLFRDLTPHEKLVSEIFSRFSIPLSFRRNSPVLFSPAVKILLLLLRLPKDNFRRDDLLSFLRSTYVSVSENSAQGLEEAVCACGAFSGSKNEWKQSLNALSRRLKLQAETLAQENALSPRTAVSADRQAEKIKQLEQKAQHVKFLAQKLFFLLAGFDAFLRNKSFHFFLDAYEKLIRKFNVEKNCASSPDAALLKNDMQNVSAFRGALDELRKLSASSDGQMSIEDFYNMVVEALSEEVVAAPVSDGGVSVLNIADAVGFRFSHVFLPCLTENLFPKKQYENPLLKSTERLSLRKLLDRPSSFRTLTEKYLEDPLLFYLALHCAEQQVFLSYSTMDFQGRPTVRSRFVDEVLETFQDEACPYTLDRAATPLDENGEPVPVPYVSVSDAEPPRSFFTQDEFFSHLATGIFSRRRSPEDAPHGFHALFHNHVHPLHKPLMRILSLIITEKQREIFYNEHDRKKRGEDSAANAFTGRLSDEFVRAFVAGQFAQKSAFSASFLESYGTCPFQFFYKEVLKFSELEETQLEISPLVEGSLVHEVLAEFFKTFPCLTGDEKEEKTLFAIFNERWDEWRQKQYLGNDALQNAKHAALKKALRRFYAHECERAEGWRWDAALIEKEMKRELSAAGIKINFYGRADKIEFKKEGDGFHLRVVDFKTSKNAASDSNGEKVKVVAAGVLGFQLPLYSWLAEEEFHEDKKRAVSHVSAEYRAVRAEKQKNFAAAVSETLPGARKKTPVNFSDPVRKEQFLKSVSGVLSRIRQGHFDVTPYSKEISCGFCAFKTVCRYEDVLESPLKEEGAGLVNDT